MQPPRVFQIKPETHPPGINQVTVLQFYSLRSDLSIINPGARHTAIVNQAKRTILPTQDGMHRF